MLEIHEIPLVAIGDDGSRARDCQGWLVGFPHPLETLTGSTVEPWEKAEGVGFEPAALSRCRGPACETGALGPVPPCQESVRGKLDDLEPILLEGLQNIDEGFESNGLNNIGVYPQIVGAKNVFISL